MAVERCAVLRQQAGTIAGNLVAEGSVDGGSTYPIGAVFTDPNWTIMNGDAASLVLTNPSAAQNWVVRVASPIDHLRVRVSVYTSGTANGNLLATTNWSSLLEATTTEGTATPTRMLVVG